MDSTKARPRRAVEADRGRIGYGLWCYGLEARTGINLTGLAVVMLVVRRLVGLAATALVVVMAGYREESERRQEEKEQNFTYGVLLLFWGDGKMPGQGVGSFDESDALPSLPVQATIIRASGEAASAR